MPSDYSPIVVDSINHETFPEVELYVKHGKGYTLYKPAETKLTIQNIERLRENGTVIIYINSSNSEEVQAHIEKYFETISKSKTLSQFSRNLICSQLIINAITDVFRHSDMSAAYQKCRIILKQVSLKFDNCTELIDLFLKLQEYFKNYLVTHTAQVTILSMYLYEKIFNASNNILIDIGVGAMLHDIGMLHISSDILEKTDVLSESEYHRVKTHPKHGSDMLINVGINEQVPHDITLNHHERYDGSGYPKGLNGEHIPSYAMLVAICDIYCALTMDRPHRCASAPEDVLDILKSESKLFNPHILSAFFENMTNTSLSEKVDEENSISQTSTKTIDSKVIQEFRRKMRASINDRNQLLQLHSQLTDNINNSYGEEKNTLVALRKDLKDLLNSLFSEGAKNIV